MKNTIIGKKRLVLVLSIITISFIATSCHSKVYNEAMRQCKMYEKTIKSATSVFDLPVGMQAYTGPLSYLEGDEASAFRKRKSELDGMFEYEFNTLATKETYFLENGSANEKYKLELENGVVKLYKNDVLYKNGRWNLYTSNTTYGVEINFNDGPKDVYNKYGTMFMDFCNKTWEGEFGLEEYKYDHYGASYYGKSSLVSLNYC